jgi:hypothetical protein
MSRSGVSGSGLKSPPRCPKANAICERVIGTIRRECLDWLIPPVRSPPALHPTNLDRSLQWRPPAHGAGSRCSRSAGQYHRPPESAFAASSRRILCGPCQTGPWRAASRILPRDWLRLTEFLRTTVRQVRGRFSRLNRQRPKDHAPEIGQLLHLKHSPIRTSGDGNENVFGRCSRLDGDAVAPFETADRKIWDSVGPDWPPKNRTDWSVRFAAKSSLTGRTFCPEDEALFDCGDH